MCSPPLGHFLGEAPPWGARPTILKFDHFCDSWRCLGHGACLVPPQCSGREAVVLTGTSLGVTDLDHHVWFLKLHLACVLCVVQGTCLMASSKNQSDHSSSGQKKDGRSDTPPGCLSQKVTGGQALLDPLNFSNWIFSVAFHFFFFCQQVTYHVSNFIIFIIILKLL